SFFCFTATATTSIYPLSLHDALPISEPAAGLDPRVPQSQGRSSGAEKARAFRVPVHARERRTTGEISSAGGPGCHQAGPGQDISDRKSTRLNSSHDQISYAVFCLKKK